MNGETGFLSSPVTCVSWARLGSGDAAAIAADLRALRSCPKHHAGTRGWL